MPIPIQLLAGQIFARDFRILVPLAQGGMGAVYVVEQLSTGKKRALKIMLPQLVSDPRARERFQQEARIGSQIESEHIVEVVSAGIEEGLPWLAMELLEGCDLAAMLRARGPVPIPELYEILQQLGDGLGAAHARGIVHRDLKPENVFIATSRRRGVPFTVKMLDFGVAKLTQESRVSASATAALGSPMWMAPEQTAQTAQLRPATDVWALGLLVFHLLTGRFYWRAANQSEVRLTALFTEVLVTPIDPATMRAAQLGVGHLVPLGFDAWFARCLERDPDRRWSDARAAIAALSPQLGLREEAAGAVPATSLQPAFAPPRGIAPTMPMSALEARPETRAAADAYGPWPHQGPEAAHGVPPGWHAPAYAGASHPPTASTPYAVHGHSKATDAVARRSPHRGALIAIGSFAALIGAGMSAFGGLLWMERLSRSSSGGAPAAAIAHGPSDGGLASGDTSRGVAMLEDDAGAPRGPNADSRVGSASPSEPGSGSSSATGSGLGSDPISASPSGANRTVSGSAAETSSGSPSGSAAGSTEDTSSTSASESDPSSASESDPSSSSATATASRFEWADGTTQTFQGSWSGHGWRYQITLELARQGQEVSGVITWRLLETTSEEHQDRIGEEAEEWVTGTWAESGSLRLDGYRTSDPSLINPDHYELRVSAAGGVSGRSRSDGGRLNARALR